MYGGKEQYFQNGKKTQKQGRLAGKSREALTTKTLRHDQRLLPTNSTGANQGEEQKGESILLNAFVLEVLFSGKNDNQ